MKCNEQKPICEYCRYTKRTCIYPILAPIKGYRRKTSRSPQESKDEKTSTPHSSTTAISPISSSSTSDKLNNLYVSNNEVPDINPYHYDKLSRDLVLTNSTSMLGITRFELRLLQFFDQECINFFSFGVNKNIHNTWKYKVPYLFLESELVRKSMFALSAMGLLTTLDLDELQSIDADEDEKSLVNIYNTNVDELDNIFENTTKYFMDTISKTKHMIGSIEDDSNIASFDDPKSAKELLVSSILVFSYLGVHPHRLLPLIDFTQERGDLIQISKGIRYTIMSCAPTILKSDMSPLLFFHGIEKMQTPTFEKCQYPIIQDLKNDIDEFGSGEGSSEISEELSILKDVVARLMMCINGCKFFKFPIPLFRFLMLFDDHFRDLLYNKHRLALRILYVYSALCSICRFQFFDERNVWKDYMTWYRGYAAENFDGYKNETDEYLYFLAAIEHFHWDDFTNFDKFNPKAEFEKVIQSGKYRKQLLLVGQNLNC